MAVTTLAPDMLAKMFLAGAKNLESKKEHINELNVFPVPDGDTGTNMTLTIMSAAKEVDALGDVTMADFCKAVSSGSLRGARGNSGVILSQIFRGFTKIAKTYDSLDCVTIAAACEKAVETAYKAVMQPKEGTILTVAKAMGEKASEVAYRGEQDIEVLLKEVIEAGNAALQKTPELLPVLKEAGVVDSGGAGLLAVIEGVYDGLLGKGIPFTMDEGTDAAAGEVRKFEEKEEEKLPEFLYHTYAAIILNKGVKIPTENDLRKYLKEIGDEAQASIDGNVVNMSVNTNDPGFVIQKALTYGEIIDVSVKNRKRDLPEENKALKAEAKADTAKEAEIKAAPAEPAKEYGFVSVAAGAGIAEIMRNLGADVVIEGGQTMNPSTEDILKAVEKVNAKTVYVLPNNKNIILAANQAAGLEKEKQVCVIPAKTIPQGITALIAFIPDASFEENKDAMTEAALGVKTGEITYAVRDTTIDGIEIHAGDYMAVGDAGILSEGKDIEEVGLKMLEAMTGGSGDVISIYSGADVKPKEAESFKKKIMEKYPSADVELAEGGQPVYYYIISAE